MASTQDHKLRNHEVGMLSLDYLSKLYVENEVENAEILHEHQKFGSFEVAHHRK